MRFAEKHQILPEMYMTAILFGIGLGISDVLEQLGVRNAAYELLFALGTHQVLSDFDIFDAVETNYVKTGDQKLWETLFREVLLTHKAHFVSLE